MKKIIQGCKMKEIIFKNLTSPDNKIKNISTTQIQKSNNILIESCRETKYLVHNPVQVYNLKNHSLKRPDIYILKNFDTNNNTKKFTWKIKGEILTNHNDKTFLLDYEHSFSLEIVNLEKAKKGLEKNEEKRKS